MKIVFLILKGFKSPKYFRFKIKLNLKKLKIATKIVKKPTPQNRWKGLPNTLDTSLLYWRNTMTIRKLAFSKIYSLESHYLVQKKNMTQAPVGPPFFDHYPVLPFTSQKTLFSQRPPDQLKVS